MRISGSAITKNVILEIIDNANQMLLSQTYHADTTQDIIRAANLILNTTDEEIVTHKNTFLFILLLEQLLAPEDNTFLRSLLVELKLKEIRFIGMNLDITAIHSYDAIVMENKSKEKLVPDFEGEFILPPEGATGNVQMRTRIDQNFYQIRDLLVDHEGNILQVISEGLEPVGLESAYREKNDNGNQAFEGVV